MNRISDYRYLLHRAKMWLNTKEKDPETFGRKPGRTDSFII